MNAVTQCILLLLLTAIISGCSSDLPRQSNLDRPRVIGIRLDKPVVLPGQTNKVELFLYDPRWRKPRISWALSLNPLPTEAIYPDFGDPATLTINDGFLYLGEGSSVFIPEVPVDEASVQALVKNDIELFSLPLVAFIDIVDEDRLFAFKQMRLQITQATRHFLEQEEYYQNATSAEQDNLLRQRLEEVFNVNPTAGVAEFSTTSSTLAIDERNDLPERKRLTMEADSLSTQQGGIVRASWPITDSDNELSGKNLMRGDNGFNLLAVRGFMEQAIRTELDLFTVDFSFEKQLESSTFEEPQFVSLETGIYFGALVGQDRRGGVVWKPFSVDVESSKPEVDEGRVPVLVRDESLVFWLAVTEADATYLGSVTQAVVVGYPHLYPAENIDHKFPLTMTEASIDYAASASISSAMVTDIALSGYSPAQLVSDLPLLHSTFSMPVSWLVQFVR